MRYSSIFSLSGIPIPIHVDKTCPKSNITPDLVEPSVGCMVEFYQISMSSITERSVCWKFAITQFVISTLTNVKLHRPASRHCSVTSSIAIRVFQTQPASTPVVYFALLEISIIREPTFIDRLLPVIKGIVGGRYFPSL